MTNHASFSGRVRVAIIGGTGYGGAELIRLLHVHPNVELVRVTSIDAVGEPLEAVHRNLGPTGLRFEDTPPEQAMRDVDVVFLALPHKVTAALAPAIQQTEARVIDLSGDFRLRDAETYKRFYGQVHPHPELLGSFVYGLPELHRESIRSARRIASPGCFATTIALGVLPVVRAGWLRGPIRTVAATGSSGSGAYASEGTHHPVRVNNLKTYKVLDHQHTPEIEQTLGDALALAGHEGVVQLLFVPVSAPLSRGILANSFVDVPAEVDDAAVADVFARCYADSPLVRVLGGGKRQAEVVAVKGSMWADLSWTLGPIGVGGTRHLVVTSALDNLVKGGAGQAVQSMNVMLGLRDGTGIDAVPLWP
ncbi:MAG: N-acetyl-gamma-glutamyl-phosphate reductase [Deltaproteobacteria bacterium]|nr:N-acetyl-gamma-glutamyl-phosphate reductase [Deltaproteobacteria bacterium]MBK8720342.1 N-acetyl-gamma-glutamyl-phosphate reductase [Deltaproteobacteria bacterium]MBP7290595.1 N-acetyl-gamma-glutamyl-phosphate reductase [Nannocystaceae bacterium]